MDIYESVNQIILNNLENRNFTGWTSGLKPINDNSIYSTWNYNLLSKKPYSLLNSFMLDYAKEKFGFTGNLWLTFNQAKNLGGSVAGEKSKAFVVFFKMIEKEKANETDKDGNPVKVVYPYLSYSSVFNICQVKGLDQSKVPEIKNLGNLTYADNNIDDSINRYCNLAGIKQIYQGMQPYYAPATDCICMPEKTSYKDSDHYYSAYLHEVTHSTGHPDRLNRFETNSSIDSYAKEELVAEVGTSYLQQIFGIKTDLTNEAAYIDAWKKKIKDDKYLVVSAFSKAEKACEYIIDRMLVKEKTKESLPVANKDRCR